MTRVVACQNAIGNYDGTVTDGAFAKAKAKFRDQYEIPQNLDLFWNGDECGSRSDHFIKESKPWVKRWLKGELYESVAEGLAVDLGEMHDCPVGWVFFGDHKYEPGGRYAFNRAIYKEFIRIGTRSRKKWHLDLIGKPANAKFKSWVLEQIK